MAGLVACGGDDAPMGSGTDGEASSSSSTAADASSTAADGSGTAVATTEPEPGTTTEDADASSTGEPPPPDGKCEALMPGLNTGFEAGGFEREFILSLPSGVEDGGPWPVVFNWHGLGGNAQNMSTLVDGIVDNETMPFIGVTPEDTDFMLDLIPQSLDWEVFAVEEMNREVALYDEVIDCLDQRYGVDFDHVHSMGFSLGSILTDMLATMRGEELASVATYSGGYWNNSENVAGLLGSVVSWPEHSVTNTYPQLFLHGGETDTFGVAVLTLQFNQFAESDVAFLNARGHDAVICDHGGGHTAPPADMGPQRLIEFFADHPLGTTDSPYASGLPGNYADYCTFSGKD